MLYRNPRLKIVIILFILIMGLSVGFAAFSKTLNVTTTHKVQPNASEFSVGLSTSSSSLTSGEVTPTVLAGSIEATNLVITNNNGVSSISGGSAKITGAGPALSYEFYVYNSGKYTAYLNSVTFNNVSGESSFKVCTPLPGETTSSISSDCSNLRYFLSIGSLSIINTTTNGNINNHALEPGSGEKVSIQMVYTGTKPKSDFKFEFGSIDLSYSTAD